MKTIITSRIKSRDVVRKQYYASCSICDYEIKGNSESHVEVNLRFHLDKHKYAKKKEKKK